jgi:CheY-like chemotaxis protein
MNDHHWKVLLVDDDEDDYVITRDLFKEIDYVSSDLEWAATSDRGLTAMATGNYDVVLMDYRLGGCDGLSVLREAIERGIDTPVIILTAQAGREIDLEAQEAGAEDYLYKGHLNADLLERSIRYCIERRQARKEREQLAVERQQALDEVKTLHGLLPICCNCKKIRDDHNSWSQIESYIAERSEATFSHSYCPECIEKLYPEVGDRMSTAYEAKDD